MVFRIKLPQAEEHAYYTASTRTNLPAQRIPFPPHAGHTYSMDHMFINDQMYRGEKITGILNITNNHSSLLLSYMVPDFAVKTTLQCLKQAISFLPSPTVSIFTIYLRKLLFSLFHLLHKR